MAASVSTGSFRYFGKRGMISQIYENYRSSPPEVILGKGVLKI